MKRFKNILYFADGALTVEPGLRRAVHLAQSNHARLTLIDVLPPSEASDEISERLGTDLNSVLREHRRSQLQELVEQLTEADVMVYTRVLTGIGFIEVIKQVLRNDHDLLVKDARPHADISERLFGSSDLHLLRKCPCPVWIDRPESETPYRSILAAVDPVDPENTGVAKLVLQMAASLAAREAATLHVGHAWRLYGESIMRSGRAQISDTEVDLLLSETRQRHQGTLDNLLYAADFHGIEPQVHLLQGEPADSIGGLAERVEADLIVMGTLGRTGLPGFFIGNTAEDLLQTTRASVLAVKPQGFVSPVTDP